MRKEYPRHKKYPGQKEYPDPAGQAGPTERIERLRRSAVDGSARARPQKGQPPASSAWRRESWTLPRDEARQKAREFLERYPRAAYWSEVESWRVLDDDRIEFTMRRLPSAD